MGRTEELSEIYIANIVNYLHTNNFAQLSYALLRDYRGDDSLTDKEIVAIFETVVEAGDHNAACALLKLGTEWVDAIPDGDYTI